VPLRLLLRSIFRRRRVEEDLDDELSFHVAMEAAALRERTDATGAQAERQARRQLGGLAQVKDACRDALRMGWLDSLARDVTYALRSFRRSPTFTLVAILSIAAGVGANCAAFTWADALLMRPLPVPRPSEIVTVGSTTTVDGMLGLLLRTSYPEYLALRDRTKSFDGLLAYTTFIGGMSAARGEVPRLRAGAIVSANFFDTLNVVPALGRGFRPEESTVPGRDAVMILSHLVWQQQFGSDTGILGRQVYLSGIPFTVIGVAPEQFTSLEQFVRFEFYVPLMMVDRLLPNGDIPMLDARGVRNLIVKGRLRSGIDLTAARADVSVLAANLGQAWPDTNRHRDFALRTELQMRAAQMPPVAMLAALLITLAAAVLFVACANVAGLLTGRGPARAREMAVRSAIGAGRAGLVRQLMTESVLLATAGGAVGVAVGYALMLVFRHRVEIPTDLPIAFTFDLDRTVLLFSLGAAAVSALFFGLVPAIQVSRVDLTAAIKGTDDASRMRRSWGRGLLIVGQVAVSVVLLVIATFTYRSFRKELTGGPGYRLDHLLLMSFDTTLVRYSEKESVEFFDRLVEKARQLPGVRSAALTSAVPMQTVRLDLATVIPEGQVMPAGKDGIDVMTAHIGERYFSTIGIDIIRGREFRRDDGAAAPAVAIVNELFAKHHWPGQDAVGKRLRVRNAGRADSVAEVVGVAETSRYVILAEPPTEYLYLPARQNPEPALILVTQTEADPSSLAAPLKRVVGSLDPAMPVYDVRTMDEFYRVSTVGLMNTIIGIIGTMGAVGLALSLVGLYGLIAYAASRRTKEIGVRMALGADRFAVLRMIMKQGIALSCAGLAIGLVASIVAGELLAATFVGAPAEKARDFTSLLLVASGVLAVTGIAAYIPARHASRTDPLNALRYE
jgi:predicted permease